MYNLVPYRMAFRLLRKRRRQAVAEQELLFGPEDEAEARLLSSRCFFHMNEVVSESYNNEVKVREEGSNTAAAKTIKAARTTMHKTR